MGFMGSHLLSRARSSFSIFMRNKLILLRSAPLLAGDVAPIDSHGMTRDKGSRLRAQPHNCFGHLLVSSHAPHRFKDRRELGLGLRITPGVTLDHGCAD